MLRIDTTLAFGLAGAARAAGVAEAAGFDGVWTVETRRDAFLPLVVAAEHTARIQVGTAGAVAFARTPMTVATLAYDLQVFSRGRFVLGLGSVPADHVTQRYGMPGSQPAERMREFILAVRAIWDSWNHAAPLDFRGRFYTHTLMTPLYDPGPNPYGDPPIVVVTADEAFAELAGEVADGLRWSGLCSPEEFGDRVLAAVDRGRAHRQHPGHFEVSAPVIVATAPTDEELDLAIRAARRRVAGVDDRTFEHLAVVGEPRSVGAELRRRFGSAVQRVTVEAALAGDPVLWRDAIAALRAGFSGAATPVGVVPSRLMPAADR